MLSKSLRETLVHVWQTLQTLNCPVAVLGGASLSIWGHGRFTKDVDLIL